MRCWLFTEQSYHPAWDRIEGSLRITPPTSIMDRETVAGLLNRYLDEVGLADEFGFDIMINEHHSSMTCMSAIPAISLAVLARETRKARLLCLGAPMANRADPLRVAEEIAVLDNLSRGRIDFGFVKGSGWELFTSNQNPARMMDRYWEAHDLVLKAWATRDGPFSWEGEYYHYRAVNITPPIYQSPHPPLWMPGASVESARMAAQKGYILSSFLCGHQAKANFAQYREEHRKVHGRDAELDRLGYLAMVVTADNEAEAARRGKALYAYYSTLPRSPPNSFNPPGYSHVEADAQGVLRGGAKAYNWVMPDGSPLPPDPSLEVLAEAGLLFWGTPDQVVRQIKRFSEQVGGLGHLICMVQGGYLEHAETADSIKLLGREVYPQLKEYKPVAEPA